MAVTVGMEGNYYTEVSSDELQEGMEVVIPSEGVSSLEMLFRGMGAAGGM